MKQTIISWSFFRQIIIPAFVLALICWASSRQWGTLPPLTLFLDVWNGAYNLARLTNEPESQSLHFKGLSSTVTVCRDERGVPHIFASNQRDAAFALGYLTAKDRLFQMDFQTRVATGRLAEVLGERAIDNDKYLRRTGMYLGAERTMAVIEQNKPDLKNLLEIYTQGVNTYINSLTDADLPLEFRLLHYKPEPWKPINTLFVNQIMALDLTFTGQSNDVKRAMLLEKLGETAMKELYPEHTPMPEPQSPEFQGIYTGSPKTQNTNITYSQTLHNTMELFLAHVRHAAQVFRDDAEGKGSNNWVATGNKTKSGKPLLAGDPHLSLSLPAIWYEAHIVTPETNIYGVTIPGTPGIIVGYNDYIAWSPTNTGADVLDFYTVTFENEHQQRYKYKGEWIPVHEDIRPLRVKGKPDLADTVRFTRWGPVITVQKQTLAIRWTAHESSTLLEALQGFQTAQNWKDFQSAQRYWDIPAQNLVFADNSGTIALRSCGKYPIRKKGHGKFIHNGETDEGEWIGYIPFESLPASVNPTRNWLESANQEPVPANYPYYLNYDWSNSLRAKRITQVLASTEQFDGNSFRALQTDVVSMQFYSIRDLLEQCIAEANINDPVKKAALEKLRSWNGVTGVESTETLLFKIFWDNFIPSVWDEIPDSISHYPQQDLLLFLLQNNPESIWFDDRRTPEREQAKDICRRSILSAVDTLVIKYGSNPQNWAWGKNHTLVLRHLLRQTSVKPLWRGPFPFPGFSSTVLPAAGWTVTNSASWRMVVDFKDGKPAGSGVYPGGPSGNPLSPYYDNQVSMWLSGNLYPHYKPGSPETLDKSKILQTLILKP